MAGDDEAIKEKKYSDEMDTSVTKCRKKNFQNHSTVTNDVAEDEGRSTFKVLQRDCMCCRLLSILCLYGNASRKILVILSAASVHLLRSFDAIHFFSKCL